MNRRLLVAMSLLGAAAVAVAVAASWQEADAEYRYDAEWDPWIITGDDGGVWATMHRNGHDTIVYVWNPLDADVGPIVGEGNDPAIINQTEHHHWDIWWMTGTVSSDTLGVDVDNGTHHAPVFGWRHSPVPIQYHVHVSDRLYEVEGRASDLEAEDRKIWEFYVATNKITFANAERITVLEDAVSRMNATVTSQAETIAVLERLLNEPPTPVPDSPLPPPN